MRVVVLTTSYPRGSGDVAGVFVQEAVKHLRNAGLDITVVSPAGFRHFGLAYGHGIVGNLRRKPWLALALPLFVLSYARAARRAARGADLVHAHWLPSALPALATGKPFVLQLWGTDVELARRVSPASRWLVRRARLVLCPSKALADAARELGAREVQVVPSGVDLPNDVNFQFRFEAFNALNTAHFNNPGANVSNLQLNPDGTVRNLNGFSEVTGAYGERQLRIGARLGW